MTLGALIREQGKRLPNASFASHSQSSSFPDSSGLQTAASTTTSHGLPTPFYSHAYPSSHTIRRNPSSDLSPHHRLRNPLFHLSIRFDPLIIPNHILRHSNDLFTSNPAFISLRGCNYPIFPIGALNRLLKRHSWPPLTLSPCPRSCPICAATILDHKSALHFYNFPFSSSAHIFLLNPPPLLLQLAYFQVYLTLTPSSLPSWRTMQLS